MSKSFGKHVSERGKRASVAHRSTEEEILAGARDALLAIENADCTLDDLLDDEKFRNMRRILSHLLLGYFKHKKVIDSTLAEFFRKTPAPPTHALLKAALTQALLQKRMAPQAVVNVAVEVAKKERNQGFVNAVLRRALEKSSGKELSTLPEDVLPETLLARWKKHFTHPQLQELTTAFLSTPEFTFRMERGTVPASFDYHEAYTIDKRFPFGAAAPAHVLESEEFKSGNIYIQDPAASLAPSMAPEESFECILDLCSAPGGKSLMLLEKYPEVKKFIAYDRSARRHKLTEKNFALRKIFHTVTCDPACLEEKWNLILIDAPCTNTGVFRRRPDALWRFSSAELYKTVDIQRELLDFSAARLASGGYILYSTCSIESEEDEKQVENFLNTHADFTLINQKKLLPGTLHDGAFCALLAKKQAG